MELFKKRIVVGVSVTPGLGLEVAQIDLASRTVLKYGVKPLEYDINLKNIADVDIFKETLNDLLLELDIPKNSEIVLNIPTINFRVNDYPAALDELQITNAIEEELLENYLFKETEACISATRVPNSSMQFNKIAYTAAQKATLIEIAMIIKELGYKLHAIDTSLNSALNALMYVERVNVEPDTSWVLLVVDSFSARVVSMLGRNYVDAFEERISIGEVLGDAENYSTVLSAVSPLLKNMPSKYLCVVSKTNIISAEVLASKLSYSSPIIHQEANGYSREAFLEVGPNVDANLAKSVSLDVIGASIYRDAMVSEVRFNLFNQSLGDVYTMEQPPVLKIAGREIVLSNENLIKFFIIIFILLTVVTVVPLMYFINVNNASKAEVENLDREIADVNKILKDNENISTDLFDEGDEIRLGLGHNKNIYSYYSIVGTEIPKKLWLTHLKLSDKTTIEGQADNLESVYAFFRSVKDYNPSSQIKLQKLGLASSSTLETFNENEGFDTDSILTSMNADFYEFKISDEPEQSKVELKGEGENSDLPNITDIEQ